MVTDSTVLLSFHIANIPINTLLDSGATHCFIDSTLVSNHCLPMTLLSQHMCLHFFNGLYAPEKILYEVTFPVYFTPTKVLLVSFLITPLDPNVSAVIRLCWLHQYNPLVDWANNCIEFQTPNISALAPLSVSISITVHRLETPTVMAPPASPASPAILALLAPPAAKRNKTLQTPELSRVPKV